MYDYCIHRSIVVVDSTIPDSGVAAASANTSQSKSLYHSGRRHSSSNLPVNKSISERSHTALASTSALTKQTSIHQTAKQSRESQSKKAIVNDASHQARKDTYLINNEEVIVDSDGSDLDGIYNSDMDYQLILIS